VPITLLKQWPPSPTHPAFFCRRHGAFGLRRIGMRDGSMLAGGIMKYWLPSLTTFHPWLWTRKW
jgi:hypothetical protein